MHFDDELQKHAAISRRDSHYSSQRTALSYSTSRSRRRSLSIDNGNHSNYNTRSTQVSRPDSIPYLDSENFTLVDEYSFIDGRNDTRGIRPLSNGSLSYIDNIITRTKSSERNTIAPLTEDRKMVSNFSRKGSLASVASKKSGKSHKYKTRQKNGDVNQVSSPRDLPGTRCSAYGNILGGGGGAGSSGNGFEAFEGQCPGVRGGHAKTTSDLLPDRVDQKHPSHFALDDGKDSVDQGRKINARVRADVISPAIHLRDWFQISYGAPNSRLGKDASNTYDYDEEELHDEVPIHSARHDDMSSGTSLTRWKVMDKFALLGYLTVFSILGTLARIGLEKLTFYPGAPVSTSVLWANFTGCFIIGLLSCGSQLAKHNSSLAQRQHTGLNRYGHSEKIRGTANSTKFTSSLYIGLTTGFCGSLTSFSALMHDAFLSISNDMPGLGSDMGIFVNDEIRAATNGGLSRSAFYSILAVLATLIINAALSIGAFVGGQHLAGGLSSALPMLSKIVIGTRNTSKGRKGNIIHIAVVLIGALSWSIIIISIALSTTLNIPANTRTTILFPLAFAPPGCLLRYSLSKLNRPFQRRIREFSPKGTTIVNQTRFSYGSPRSRTLWQRFSSSKLVSTVCLGTLIANLLGTLIFSLSWDFQHGLGYGSGTGPVTSPRLSSLSCQVLVGIQDGFCGALTTVSTLVQEIVGMVGASKRGQGQQGRPHMQQQYNRKQELQQEQGERWWVEHREQRQKQRRRQELERSEQRGIRRRRSLESAPTERDLSMLELREAMKPQARFIASARSDYRDDEDGRNNHNHHHHSNNKKDNNNSPFHNEDVLVVVDDDDDHDQRVGAGVVYGEDRVYKHAYAYGHRDTSRRTGGSGCSDGVSEVVDWWMG